MTELIQRFQSQPLWFIILIAVLYLAALSVFLYTLYYYSNLRQRRSKFKNDRKKTLILLLGILSMMGCSKDVIEGSPADDGSAAEANSLLQVTTRSTNDAVISYPVQVYVFQGDECKAVQTIGDAGQTLNIALTEGTYSVYAIGGASSTDYNLPTKEDATTTTALTLKDGKALTDLMAATATATLVDGGTNTVTLGLARKVMMIQDIEIKKIPTAATAVSVTFAPLWENVTVGGTYAGTSGSTTIALTRQNDNIDYTRRHAMRRKQKSDEPQPDGGGTDGGDSDGGDSDVTPVTPEA